MSDLELYSETDLINELLNRCDYGFVVLARNGRPLPTQREIRRLWKGDIQVILEELDDSKNFVLDKSLAEGGIQ